MSTWSFELCWPRGISRLSPLNTFEGLLEGYQSDLYGIKLQLSLKRKQKKTLLSPHSLMRGEVARRGSTAALAHSLHRRIKQGDIALLKRTVTWNHEIECSKLSVLPGITPERALVLSQCLTSTKGYVDETGIFLASLWVVVAQRIEDDNHVRAEFSQHGYRRTE